MIQVPGAGGDEAHDRHKDEALEVVNSEEGLEIDPAVERRVLRKIDLFFMPAMLVGYGFVYWDKAILGSASLFGMTSDLALSVVDYSTTPPTKNTSRLSWATSIFYFGMMAGLYPMTLVLQRFKIQHVLGPIVMLWAITCAATAGVTSWRGLFVQRFFLGFVESVIPTGFMTVISGYYTQKEQTLRQAIWFSGTGWFTIIGGALNYAFGQITTGALRPWQYIYIFAGVLTFLFGIWCCILPNSPVSAWFLTPAERVVAVERLRRGQTGVRCQTIKMSQIVEAFTDVKVYLIAIMMAAAYTINGAISGFGPLIVSTFGYNTLASILFQFPVGAICIIFIPLVGYIPTVLPNTRILLLVTCCLPVIAGCVMIWKSSWGYRPATPVVGYALTGFFGPVVSLIITLGASNVAGATKKTIMAATVFVAYAVGNIIGPQLIKSETVGQHYPELWTGMVICYCIVIAAAGALWVVLWRENRRRDAAGLDEGLRDKLGFQDLTDRENGWFRYVL
ncbi:putative MFS transporter [Aspergillus brunneoviolaceus CBS 621.78]|uniref:MFS transporter n=2 Tax=Aspergillus TaxID=5052 RepID=A0ACD1GHQ4_9EURO|nr:putative MFS transporter [Aspergillus brunneoviolaceus CBS 621.78]XP_040801396.1 putative MFS transporter [Aspergillus fijiensis CBS 313.89]RAH48819.1 putative MFS transporter [Aspergillus brunneoviolaceus CBS 621.78]RAK77386.1 putative MFS transporter [Aspergillus fijiensis CBS 313.89]